MKTTIYCICIVAIFVSFGCSDIKNTAETPKVSYDDMNAYYGKPVWEMQEFPFDINAAQALFEIQKDLDGHYGSRLNLKITSIRWDGTKEMVVIVRVISDEHGVAYSDATWAYAIKNDGTLLQKAALGGR